MLENFLGKNNAKAPLYGRAIFELQTERLDPEKGSIFLREGAKQIHVRITDEEIKDAIDHLDGIIGWLTKYGWYRQHLKHPQALEKTVQEGKLVVREEFLRFSARSSKMYESIIHAVQDGARWEEIKRKVPTSDQQLSVMLKRLIGSGFLEKKDRIYSITDPLLRAAF